MPREACTRAKGVHRRIAAAVSADACPLRTIGNRSNYAVPVPLLSAKRASGDRGRADNGSRPIAPAEFER
jgi:hypothetical protein